VGLATFAAAAISGEDAIKTGVQGSIYALRTVILPFIWIFNAQLLLIDVKSAFELVSVIVACTLATLLFAALTMNWLRVKLKAWEWVLLAIAVALLFRPDFFMDRIAPEYKSDAPAKVFDVAKGLDAGDRVVLVIKGTTIEGEDKSKTVALTLGEPVAGDAAAAGRKRLADAGLTLVALGGQVQIGQVKFGSRAQKSGFEQGWEVQNVLVPNDRPNAHWWYLPALLLAALVWVAQGRRLRGAGTVLTHKPA
jgi:hypothetical protein